MEGVADAMAAPCGHMLCAPCWASTLAVKLECPVCRAYVRPKQLHRTSGAGGDAAAVAAALACAACGACACDGGMQVSSCGHAACRACWASRLAAPAPACPACGAFVSAARLVRLHFNS